MFKNMMEQVKKHPYLIGGAVLGPVILLWLSSRSSGSAASSGTTIVATQPTVDPSIAAAQASIAQSQIGANAAVQVAQISADSQTSQQRDAIAGAQNLQAIGGQYSYLMNYTNNTTARGQTKAALQAATTADATKLKEYLAGIGGAQEINAQNVKGSLQADSMKVALDKYLAGQAMTGYKASGYTGGAAGGGVVYGAAQPQGYGQSWYWPWTQQGAGSRQTSGSGGSSSSDQAAAGGLIGEALGMLGNLGGLLG